MIELTEEQTQYVESRRKSPRPKRYDSTLGLFMEISEDLETYLILTPFAERKQIIDYIKAVVDAVPITDEDNEILDQTISQAKNNATTLMESAESSDTSIGKLPSPAGFRTIAELQSLYASIKDAGSLIERNYYDAKQSYNIVNFLDTIRDSFISTPKKQELKSWVGILLSY